MTTTNFDQTQIQEAAYYLWLEAGQPNGRDQEHWLKAIDALSKPEPKRKAVRKAAAKPPAPKAPAKRSVKKVTKAKAAVK